MGEQKIYKYKTLPTEYEVFTHIMSVAEVAAYYGIPRTTIRRWCDEGKITAQKLHGCREWTIARASVIRRLGYPQNPKIADN